MNIAAAINLDDYEHAEWLEDARAGMFARYQIGTEPTGEGITEWFCTDCGSPVDDTDEGCDVCGLGVMEEPSDD